VRQPHVVPLGGHADVHPGASGTHPDFTLHPEALQSDDLGLDGTHGTLSRDPDADSVLRRRSCRQVSHHQSTKPRSTRFLVFTQPTSVSTTS
jgi:hypothetical protein